MAEKSELFDRELKALIKQSSEVLNVRYGISNTTGKVRKEVACMTRFENVYNGLNKPSEFYIYFEKLFSKKRTSILKSLTNDTWLKNGNVVIQFAEYTDDDEIKEKCENVKILLSNIYNCALELKELSLNTYSDLSEELAGSDKNLIRPSIMLLHLTRIFYILIEDEDDKLALSIMVDTLENDLNVKNKTVKPIVGPNGNINPLANFNFDPTTISETLSSVFGGLATIAKQLDIPGLEDIQAPTSQQLKEGVESTINNEKIQNSIGNLMKALNNKEDLISSATNFLQETLTPEMIQSAQSALLKTAEIAKDNSISK
jgi:hypothetical protein